ncbi:class I SAM-dependent methyltransferase [Algoriphagus kandeliae]|uniref:Class I SAM-dependent methyltransferase n=1 Tax=Algoriphagus kandeliae TaxID=2562278 RepID=A0A4Y9QVQ8_9BACT|nr:class I SAM-dependent methyltransferase [Algoriphagus kandeliae]TFV95552.1 class I SAM-dependent methyltransferase [Algoriphagus kandeliae]
MRQISCPVCQSAPQSTPKSFSIIPCSNCGVGWTWIPDEIDEASLYRDEVYQIVDNRQSIFEKIIFREARKILIGARKMNPAAKRLLDFGSGKGQFLSVAKKLDWDGIGIETEKARADFALEKYGVKVLNQFYERGLIGENKYDLITLNHVLEHLPKPINMLNELLQENLAEKGILYLEVPRSDSWQARIAGKNWMHWDIPKHLTHWTEEGLKKELAKLGFVAVGSRSFSIHLGVLGMLQALLSRLGFRENLILRLKRKKSLGLLFMLALALPLAWVIEFISTFFGKSGILGLYFKRHV